VQQQQGVEAFHPIVKHLTMCGRQVKNDGWHFDLFVSRLPWPLLLLLQAVTSADALDIRHLLQKLKHCAAGGTPANTAAAAALQELVSLIGCSSCCSHHDRYELAVIGQLTLPVTMNVTGVVFCQRSTLKLTHSKVNNNVNISFMKLGVEYVNCS
jgi:hypothetical protein